MATFLGTPSSANLASALTDETGSGLAVFGTSPVITTPTLAGGTASNTSRWTVPNATKATLDGLTRVEGVIAYGTDTDQLYADDGSTLRAIGTSSQGQINVILNPNDNYATWATTGSGPTATTTLTAGNLPLNSVVGVTTAIQLTSNAAAQTEASNYLGYAFTSPQTFNQKLAVSFWMVPGSNFIANEWSVSIYAGATRQNLSTDSSGVTYLPSLTGKFTTTFDATASTAYTLRFARPVNAGGNAAVLNVNGVIVGPGVQPQGAVVGEWQNYTPTGTWVSNVTYTGKWRRVGDTMEGQVQLNVTGAPTSTGLFVNIPTGYTIDTSKIVQPTGGAGYTRQFSFGPVTIRDEGTDSYLGGVGYNDTTSLSIYYQNTTGGVATVTQAAPFTFANTDDVSINFKVPISEWGGNGVVNVVQNDVEYASNNATWDGAGASGTTVYGPAGSAMAGALTNTRSKVLQWLTPIQSTDTFEIQISDGSNWVSAAQFGVSAIRQGASFYGVSMVHTSSSQSAVSFYTTASASNATYAGAGTAWNSAWSWRVLKMKAGMAVGFGVAPASNVNQAGLVSPNNVACSVHSGTYTPTYANVANVSAFAANVASYIRVGSYVTVFFSVNTTATAAAPTATSFTMTLPIASDIGTAFDLVGTWMRDLGTTSIDEGGIIYGVAAGDLARIDYTATSASNKTGMGQFMYKII